MTAGADISTSVSWFLGPWLVPILVAAAALLSTLLIIILRPLFARYAMARPNARSSHRVPTPQGGGIAVIASTIVIAVAALAFIPDGHSHALPILLAATAGLAVIGFIDDIRALDALPRLILQVVAMACVIAALPETLRVLPALPWWLERMLLMLAGVWFVNLVNFMDGIDWMTVMQVVPMTAGLAIAGSLGALPPQGLVIALTLLGAMIGFAPFNKPVAKLFLGDVGSLPIGLLLTWLLILLAGQGHLAAALLLPLYYLSDATLTLLWRLAKGHRVTQAHRLHFYQVATDRGHSVIAVVARVFITNLVLVALAICTIVAPSPIAASVALLLGGLFVSALLLTFCRQKTGTAAADRR